MSAAQTINVNQALERQAKLTLHPDSVLLRPEKNTRSGKPHNYAETKNSIRQVGIRQPVILRVHDGTEVMEKDGVEVPIPKGTAEVVAGFTRVQIAKELTAENPDSPVLVPYTVGVYDLENLDLQLLDENIRENFFREDLSPMAIGRSIDVYMTRHGIKSYKAVAEKFGKSEAWVRQNHRLLTDLHPDLQARVDKRPDEDGYIPGSTAWALIGKTEDGKTLTPEAQLELVKQHEMDGSGIGALTREKVKALVQGTNTTTGTQSDAKPPLTMKQFRQFIDSMEEVPGEDEKQSKIKSPMNEFVAKTQKFLDGKLGERAMRKYLSTLFDTVEDDQAAA